MTPRIISSDEINRSADFWFYEIGVNVIPTDTKRKRTYVKWSQWQHNSVPEDLHEEQKRNGDYNNGIAVITGRIWRGPFEGKYLLAIDLDNSKAIAEFVKDKLEYYKEKTLVEQHANPDKMHIYFIVDKEIPDKQNDKTTSNSLNIQNKLDRNEIPAIEVKGTPKRMMCCAMSPHKNGSNYQIVGTLKPQTFPASVIREQISNICSKYDIPYDSHEDDKEDAKSEITQPSVLPEELRRLVTLLQIPENFQYRISEGSRHDTMLSFSNSLLIKYRDNDRNELKNFFYEINNKICFPSLPENEIKTIWKDALKFSQDKISKIEIINNDENDKINFNTQVVYDLLPGTKLLQEEIVESFVYDTQTNSIDLWLNHKYDRKKVILEVNIKKWNDVRRTFSKLLEQKEIKKEHIDLLLEALDNNHDLIKQIVTSLERKHIAVVAEAKQRRKERLQLIGEGTDFLMAKYRFATIEDTKEILYYDPKKGVYVYGGEILIDKEMDRKYGFKLKTADITEIKNYIIRKTYTDKKEFDKDLDIINLKNCLLNWKTGQESKHTPDYLSINQKPIIYNRKAIPKKFIRFLRDIFYLQDIRTAIETIAYTFIRRNLYDYYFILIGGGSNGKSVYIGIITNLHGRDNVSNVPLKKIVNNRFASARLVNKDVNIDAELSRNFINDLSALKNYSGRQPVDVEKKGIDSFDAELWAKLIMATNELPAISDNSDGRYRREIRIQFPNQFVQNPDPEKPHEKLQDTKLLDKIVNDPEEISGILNLVINSLRIIDRSEGIHVKETIRERQENAELTADPFGAFYEKYCMKPADPTKYTRFEELYAVFTKFCNDNRIYILSSGKFNQELKKYGATQGRTYLPNPDNPNKKLRIRVWHNIHLFTEEEIKERERNEEETETETKAQIEEEE